MILTLQGKLQEIYNVLLSPLGSRLSSVSQKKAKLLLQIGRYEEAKMAYETLIPKEWVFEFHKSFFYRKLLIYSFCSLDNWTFYTDYLTAGLKCQSATECYLFIDQMVNLNYNSKVRAPQLARFELLKRAMEQDLAVKDCPSSTSLLKQYFTQFGTKDCVVSDLKRFLYLLNESEKEMMIRDVGFFEFIFQWYLVHKCLDPKYLLYKDISEKSIDFH